MIRSTIGWTIGLLAAVALLSGCASPGRMLVSSSIAADKTMQAWAVYVVDGHATLTDEDVVRRAHAAYLRAEDAALTAWLAYQKSGDKITWEEARDTLLRHQADLLMLVDKLSKGGTP